MNAIAWYRKFLHDIRQQGFERRRVPLDEVIHRKYITQNLWTYVGQYHLVSPKVKLCMLTMQHQNSEFRVVVARNWPDLMETQFRAVYSNVQYAKRPDEFNSLDLVLKASDWPRRWEDERP